MVLGCLSRNRADDQVVLKMLIGPLSGKQKAGRPVKKFSKVIVILTPKTFIALIIASLIKPSPVRIIVMNNNNVD